MYVLFIEENRLDCRIIEVSDGATFVPDQYVSRYDPKTGEPIETGTTEYEIYSFTVPTDGDDGSKLYKIAHAGEQPSEDLVKQMIARTGIQHYSVVGPYRG